MNALIHSVKVLNKGAVYFFTCPIIIIPQCFRNKGVFVTRCRHPVYRSGTQACSEISKRPLFHALSRIIFENYPLFRVKTRTILLSKIPLFLPYQGHFFKKYPFLCKNKGIIQRATQWNALLFSHFFIFITATQISFDLYLSTVPMPLSLKCLCMYISLAPWALRNKRPDQT